jgi:hexosaminidase
MLMPKPALLTMGQGELTVDPSFSIAVNGLGDARVQQSADRLMARIQKRTGMRLSPASGAPKLAVYCANKGQAVQELGEDEGYKLVVTAAGATLTAVSPLGVIHGLATFEQLVQTSANGFAVPALTIEDSPRFPWRGLHIDVSRHWMPVDVIKRNLDGMAAVKLNVFHWHLSDNQGFRVESKKYPKLHELGSDGLFYTQDQVREVLAYARERGIRVVPEFDVPGHSTSWLVGYPELGAAPGPFEIGRTWGIFDPVMDPTNEAVYQFLDGFIGEMANLFPDQYFHIGGDEVNGKEWSENPHITEFKRKHGMLGTGKPDEQALKLSNEKLQAYFNERVLAIVKKHGKKMMGWDEILAPELPKDIVIQSWRGQKSLWEAVQQGFQGILSSGYYLDHMDSGATHYAVDPMVDPLTKETLNLTPDQKARLLGGEVCMWTEYVSAENVDSRIWPRTAAVAERYWSKQEVKDSDDMYARLDVVSRQLEWYGLTHRSSYRLMLVRLAGSQPVEPLRVLADVVQPVGLSGRSRAGRNSGHPYTQQTPLNRLVDAARPESDEARRFAAMVAAKDWTGVRQSLAAWKSNQAKLAPLLQSSILREVAPVSENLTQVAVAGLAALDYIGKHQKPPAEWNLNMNKMLAEAKKPKSEVTLAIVDPVQQLVNLAGQQSGQQ